MEPWYPRSRLRTRLLCAYNWGLWTLLTVLLFAQFFGVIWSSVTTPTHFYFGQNPRLGKYSIPGSNDEPYADRAVACVKRGQYYRPMQLSQLLKEQAASTSGNSKHTTNGIDGYRIVSRDSFTMDATEFPFYERQCNALLLTLDNIMSVCNAQGYNVTRDVLRVVDGIDSDTVVVLHSTLPVLIVPYWDYGGLSRYIIPGCDGGACMFRGSGMFESETDTSVIMEIVSRAVREAKTEEFLQYGGGVWRNGWYEDPVVKMRWYSDVISSIPHGEFGAQFRRFDILGRVRESDCSVPPYGCGAGTSTWGWGDQLQMQVDLRYMNSITISNGSRFGLFLFDAAHIQTIKSHYSLEKLISNGSFAVILSRWMVAMLALSPLDAIGIGAVANSRSFRLLPLLLLPRLKLTLQSFWASGCEFEGDERALADAWFDIYPAIGELVLVYFSLLNTVSKLLRRRTSDALFGPTLLFFAFLHYLRADIAASNWLEFDKRITTAVTAAELDAATLLDFFTTDVAFRTNGEVESLFTMKLVVLGLNLVPLVFFSRLEPDNSDNRDDLCVERVLAMRFDKNGGLGSTKSSRVLSTTTKTIVLRPYEIVRGGYVAMYSGFPTTSAKSSVSGVVVSISNWPWLVVMVLLERVDATPLRVLAFEIEPAADVAKKTPTLAVSPRILNVNDNLLPELVPSRLLAPALC